MISKLDNLIAPARDDRKLADDLYSENCDESVRPLEAFVMSPIQSLNPQDIEK